MSIGTKMRGVGESTYYTKLLKQRLDDVFGEEKYVLIPEMGKRNVKLITAYPNFDQNLKNQGLAILEESLPSNISF